MHNSFTFSPRQESYYALPLWTEYLTARAEWLAAHSKYVKCSPVESTLSECRAALLAAESKQAELLARLRATPEHVEAFGW